MKNFTKGIGMFAVAIILMTQLSVSGQENAEADGMRIGDTQAARFWNPRNIEGAWNVVATIRNCTTGAAIATFPGLSLYGRGGTFTETNGTNPALRSVALGTWEHMRGNTYRFAFKFFRFDATGANIGTQVVKHTVNMDVNGNAYSSAGTAETFDPAGNLVMAGCSTATATRFF